MEKKKMWLWGYTLQEVPGTVPFVNGPSHCSLETGADYLGMENVIFMNPMHGLENLSEENFSLIADRKEVICALNSKDYVYAAQKVSAFSVQHPNITGAVFDDFYPNAKNVEEEKSRIKNIYEGLKSENPDLKLYVVRYAHSPIEEIEPYLEYIDGIIFWVWVPTEHYFRTQFIKDLEKLKKYNKVLYQGIFIQNYGELEFFRYNEANPTNPELLELQLEKTACALDFGLLDGAVVLQNGWFSFYGFRENLSIIKNFFDWYNDTRTIRDEESK